MQNAIDQAKHAALAMLGRPKTYSEVPWFWSDQYDLKLQIAGLARPDRPDGAARRSGVTQIRRLPSARRRGRGGGSGQCRAGIYDRPQADRAMARRSRRRGWPILSVPMKQMAPEDHRCPRSLSSSPTAPSRRWNRRRLVGDGRRGQESGSRHRCRLRRRLRLRHLSCLCRSRLGGGTCRPNPRWKRPCWISRQVAAPNSRLSCQLRVTSEMDGLIVRVPETQH